MRKTSIGSNNWLLPTAVAAGSLALAYYATRPAPYSFSGKVVLITGGARGLGLVIARQLAREGAKLVLCSRNSDQLARAAKELTTYGVDVMTFRCDVSRQAAVQEMVERIIDRWGRIDVLINDAGMIQVGPMETMELEDYRAAMDVHFWGPLYLIQAVMPQMRKRRAGRIVNIASIGGRISVPHLLPYSASKYALVGLSEGMRAELAKDGVLVTTISPGLMRTGSHENALFKGRHCAEYTWFSIGDALPLLSMSAESAARKIIEACRAGSAAVTLSLPARAAHLFHGIFPGLTADLMALVNRLLPGPGGIGNRRLPGKESHSSLAPSVLTALSDQAAKKNNEL